MQKLQSASLQDIRRAVRLAFIALVACLALFGGYYYWDRYVHLGDKSSLEVNIEHMEDAVRHDPQNLDARVMLAESYLKQGAYKKALTQTDQVLNLYPEHEGALLISGVAYVRMSQPAAALAPLGKLVALRKDQPLAHTDSALETAYYFLGESYLKLGRPEEAASFLESALFIVPTDADALYQLGLSLAASGQHEAALEQYRRAVRLVPNFVEVYVAMVESYSALEQRDYVTFARGMRAFCLQDYEAAQIHLEFATSALPDFAPAFLGLGLTYEKVEKMDEALTAIQRALELDPGDYAARQSQGRILAALSAKE